MKAVDVSDGSQGGWFGFRLGAFIWAAQVLGLASISTAPSLLLLGWFLGQTLELTIAGIVAGMLLGGASVRGVSVQVIVFVAVSFAITVTIQSIS